MLEVLKICCFQEFLYMQIITELRVCSVPAGGWAAGPPEEAEADGGWTGQILWRPKRCSGETGAVGEESCRREYYHCLKVSRRSLLYRTLPWQPLKTKTLQLDSESAPAVAPPQNVSGTLETSAFLCSHSWRMNTRLNCIFDDRKHTNTRKTHSVIVKTGLSNKIEVLLL